MESIKRYQWNGSLNIEVLTDSAIVLAGTQEEKCRVSFRIPRDTYLTIYLPYILERLEEILKNNVIDRYKGWWFSFDQVPLDWTYPIGVLYDSLVQLDPSFRNSTMTSDTVNVWKLVIHHDEKLPPGIIPIINGMKQIQEYWMHQWKQACFVLNGSSKQIMSLAKADSMSFWYSILNRDQKTFDRILEKILQNRDTVKNIPLKIHVASSEVKLIESITNASTYDPKLTLNDILQRACPQIFSAEEPSCFAKPIVQGIEVPLDSLILNLFNCFMSFDGFLHVSVSQVKK